MYFHIIIFIRYALIGFSGRKYYQKENIIKYVNISLFSLVSQRRDDYFSCLTFWRKKKFLTLRVVFGRKIDLSNYWALLAKEEILNNFLHTI